MVNAFITPDVIARRALAALYDQLDVMPLYHTDLTQEFTSQKVGDTINVRKPATFEAKIFNRANGIELQDVEEDTIPVKLDKIADVSFAVTAEDLTLEIGAFDEQLITPATQALAKHVNVAALSLRGDITQSVGVAGTGKAGWDTPEVLADAGMILDTHDVPLQDRAAIIGPRMYNAWLKNELIKQADKSGSTAALRQGSVGRDVFGFETFKSNLIEGPAANPATGQPTTEVGMAFHKSAFAYASAPLAVSPGSNGAVVSYRGISIRVVYDYDIKYKQTVVSLDTLYGVKTLDPNRAVLIKGANKA
jgi:hypothetical protein